jgi:hypothetical protein
MSESVFSVETPAAAATPSDSVTLVDSDTEAEEPTIDPRLRELHDRAWPSFEELFVAVSKITREIGFGVVKRRSANVDKRTGKPRRIDIECYEGRSNESKATKRVRQNSKKKDCGWKAKGVHSTKDNLWRFTVYRHTHSHEFCDQPDRLASVRRLDKTLEVTKRVHELTDTVKLTAADILACIQKEFPGTRLTRDDILNIQKARQAEESGTLTSTQQFLRHISTTPRITQRRFPESRDVPIKRVFWTYDWCFEQWKKNPEVWSLDCTYKVNKFDMPLLQINGVTAIHTTFNIGYCLLSGEREECFTWVLSVLQELLSLKGIPLPKVIISDFDKALKKAARAIFPNVQHQICLWHVMKNIAHNTKKKWVGTLEGTALGDQGSDGSHLREEEQGFSINPANYSHQARTVGVRLLSTADRQQHLGSEYRNNQLQPINSQQENALSGRKWVLNADGFLSAWKAVVYAETETDFNEQWRVLKAEFASQPGMSAFTSI